MLSSIYLDEFRSVNNVDRPRALRCDIIHPCWPPIRLNCTNLIMARISVQAESKEHISIYRESKIVNGCRKIVQLTIQNFQLRNVRSRTYSLYSSFNRPVRCLATGAPFAGSTACKWLKKNHFNENQIGLVVQSLNLSYFNELFNESRSFRSVSIFCLTESRSNRSCRMYSAPFCSIAALLNLAFGFCCNCGINECSISKPFLIL